MGKDFERLLNRDSPPPVLNARRPQPDHLHIATRPLPLPASTATQDTSDPLESNSASHSSGTVSLVVPLSKIRSRASCPAISHLSSWTAVNHPTQNQSFPSQPSGPIDQHIQPQLSASSLLPPTTPPEAVSRGRVLKPKIPTGKLLIKKASTAAIRLAPPENGENPRPSKKARTLTGAASASIFPFNPSGQLSSTTAATKESPATPSPTPSPAPDLPGGNPASGDGPSLLSPIHCKQDNPRPPVALIQDEIPSIDPENSTESKATGSDRNPLIRISPKTASAIVRLHAASSPSEHSLETNATVTSQVMPPPVRRPEPSKQGSQFDSHGGLLSPPLHHASQAGPGSLLIKSESDIQGELNAGDDPHDEHNSRPLPMSPQTRAHLSAGEASQTAGISDDYTIYRCDYCNEVWREEIAVSGQESSRIMDMTAMEAFSDMMRSQSKRVKEAYEQWKMNHDSYCASQYMLQSSGSKIRTNSPSPPPSHTARPSSQHSSHSTSEPIVFGTPFDNANTKWFDVCLGEHSGSPKPVRISEHHPYYHAIQIPSPPVHLVASNAGSPNMEYHAHDIESQREDRVGSGPHAEP